MNSIGKMIVAQGLISSIDIPYKLTPEQENNLDKCREYNIIKNTNNRGAQSNSYKKRVRHDKPGAAEETISLITQEGKDFFTHNFTHSDIKVYNYLLNTVHLTHESGVSQQRIADELGVARETVSRAIAKLETRGLIKRYTVGHLIKPGPKGIFRQHTYYKIPNFIFRKDIAFKIHGIFSALTYKARKLSKFIAIALLFANTSLTYQKYSSLSEYVTVNNRYIYKKRISTHKCLRFEENSPPFEPHREPEDTNLHQNTQILRDDDMANAPISDILRYDVTPRLGLTRRGQLFLSAFHDGALLYAIDELDALGTGECEHDFRLFVNCCQYYIKQHKHEGTVDSTRAERLMKEYGCKETTPYFYPDGYEPHAKYGPTPQPQLPPLQDKRLELTQDKRLELTQDKRLEPPKVDRSCSTKATQPTHKATVDKSQPDYSSAFFADELRALAEKIMKLPQAENSMELTPREDK